MAERTLDPGAASRSGLPCLPSMMRSNMASSLAHQRARGMPRGCPRNQRKTAGVFADAGENSAPPGNLHHGSPPRRKEERRNQVESFLNCDPGVIAPNVLVVDDEPLVRWSVAETLEESGYRVTEAGDALSALEAL